MLIVGGFSSSASVDKRKISHLRNPPPIEAEKRRR